jgi:6-phosphogluconolactonase
MKQTKKWMILAAGLLALAACQKEKNEHHDDNDRNNHVYLISNGQKTNLLLDYKRSQNGLLTYDSAYPTGGLGTGGGLGSQGAVILTEDEIILAVNAGSNTISSFKVSRNGPVLQSNIPSGGIKPISITAYNHVVFVLNAGGDGNISGFSLSGNGKLTPIPNSTRPLSTKSSGPAQVSFVNEGRVLVITEKATNTITSYAANGTMHTLTSANPTPFGFAEGTNGRIFVSEAAGGAAGASTLSSYYVDNSGVISLITGPVAAHQSAACWVVITGNGKYAYTTNTASDNVSRFDVRKNTGSISVGEAIAAGTGKGPIDAALTDNSKFLYVLTPGTNTINCFKVDQNGGLTSIQTVTDVPGTGVGLAAN